LAAAVSSGKYG
jgi:hypothetical protein